MSRAVANPMSRLAGGAVTGRSNRSSPHCVPAPPAARQGGSERKWGRQRECGEREGRGRTRAAFTGSLCGTMERYGLKRVRIGLKRVRIGLKESVANLRDLKLA